MKEQALSDTSQLEELFEELINCDCSQQLATTISDFLVATIELPKPCDLLWWREHVHSLLANQGLPHLAGVWLELATSRHANPLLAGILEVASEIMLPPSANNLGHGQDAVTDTTKLPTKLRPREAECLELLSRRRVPKQVAHEMGIEVSSVYNLMASARRSLGCKTTNEALLVFAASSVRSSRAVATWKASKDRPFEYDEVLFIVSRNHNKRDLRKELSNATRNMRSITEQWGSELLSL